MLEADAEKRNARLSPSPSPHRSRSRARTASISAGSELSGVSSAIEIPTSIPTTTVDTNRTNGLGLILGKELPPTPVEEEQSSISDDDRPATSHSAMSNDSSSNRLATNATSTADTSVASPEEPYSYDSPYMSSGDLQRRSSVFSLSRISFAAQLSRLTSLSLPLSEELSTSIRQFKSADEMCEALLSAGRQIGRWIETAKKVLAGLDAEDDVEWAAQGRESLNEVDSAVTKFSGLMNVYIELIDELQLRPDSDTVGSAQLIVIVQAMETTVEGWKSVQELLRGVKDQVETALEWTELWTTILQDIQAELDACQTLVFELEEKRHRSMAEENGGTVDIDTLETIMEDGGGGAAFPLPNGKAMAEVDDSSLLGLFARMQPLRASLDFLPMRLQSFQMRAERIFPTACDELDSRRNQLERKWQKLNADAEGLKKELGEDRWVAIFRNAGKQATAMLDSIERSMNKLREAVILWDENGGRNDNDLRKKMESYEAKKMHYGTAIQRTFSIIGKGISDRFTVNGEIIRLDTAMRNRWKYLELHMADVDQTLADLHFNSQALRDSISSLASLDIGSGANTPRSSPASSVTNTPNTVERKAVSRRPGSVPTSRKSSTSSSIPQRSPYNNRVSYSASPNISPRNTVASLAKNTSNTSASSSTSSRRTNTPSGRSSSLSSRPRWNGSTKTDDGTIGHNFKPSTLTTSSTYRKITPPTPSSRRSSTSSNSTRIPVPSPLGNGIVPTSPPSSSPGSPHMRSPSSMNSSRKPYGYLKSPTPGPRLSAPRPELKTQRSTSGLRESFRMGEDSQHPKISVRPASALAQSGVNSGRRSSMLPRPPSGVGNRSSMPPGNSNGNPLDNRPRWRYAA
ncbi:karyogamy protein [Geopyxis carbonaria]|nr:karyogamy protein [Geopyxis carbonaria]